MSEEYTPTVWQVRAHFVNSIGEREANQFNRWLAEHDRQVKAEAWDDGWDAHENSGCEDDCGVCAICLPDNPFATAIEKEETK